MPMGPTTNLLGLSASLLTVLLSLLQPVDPLTWPSASNIVIWVFGQHWLLVCVQVHQPPLRAVDVSERDLAQLLAAAFRQAAGCQGEHLPHVPARGTGRIARARVDEVGNDLRTRDRQRLHLDAVAEFMTASVGVGFPKNVQHGSRIHEATGPARVVFQKDDRITDAIPVQVTHGCELVEEAYGSLRGTPIVVTGGTVGQRDRLLLGKIPV